MSLLGLHGDVASPRTLLWLHGFTQTRHSASVLRSILAVQASVVTVDLPGHGENAHIDLNLEHTADEIAAALPDQPMVVGGYSLGGRVALHLALAHPNRVRSLVLLGATRGIENDDERAQRRHRDEALADHAEQIGIDPFLDEWLAQPMFARVGDDAAERATRSRDVHGLARSLRHMGTGTQRWLGEEIASLAMPVWALAGEHDEKFLREARAIAARAPSAKWRSVPGAAHAAHLENPEWVASVIGEALRVNQ